MTAVWFTSDLHVGGHKRVVEARGYTDPDEHDRVLAERWDAVVRPADQVWVLGDLCIGQGAPQRRALDWVSARHGVKYLIAGNHDSCHAHRSQAHRELRRYLEVFEFVSIAATLKIAGERVLLSHFPYAGPGGDHTDELRYPEWRLPDTGQWLLHGHTHTAIQQRGRQLHVGVDAHNLRPVPLTWVAARIAAEQATAQPQT